MLSWQFDIYDIYLLSENAIRDDLEPVAMQAIEFWSTITEEEVTLIFEANAAREAGPLQIGTASCS